MKKIGLYFGSFNPIHIGHLLVATYIREAAELDEIWFIVSPQNPFKESSELADENHRLEMTRQVCLEVPYFTVSNIEFLLNKPSYTHQTLKQLTLQFPGLEFQLIIGEDNVSKFHEWKEADWIQSNFKTLIYNRGRNKFYNSIKNSEFFKLPRFDISSTEIRNRILHNQSITFFVTESVKQYIMFHKLYR